MLKNVFLAFSVLVLMAGTALAGTASDTLNVTGSVADSCIVSANPMGFGPYTGVADVDAPADILVTCTNSTLWSLGIDGTREMTGPGGAILAFSIFQDAGHTVPFGDTGSGNEVTGSGSGAAQTETAYGVIPAGQFPTPGAYSTNLQATVTF